MLDAAAWQTCGKIVPVKNAWGIFVHDLKQLVRNPFALAVAIGIVLLPSLFAWYSVAAVWNPYSHLDGLKVAIVNEDRGVAAKDVNSQSIDATALAEMLDGEAELNIGDQLARTMQEDGGLDWQFVDAATAESGLASGDYYAEFILPESFTSDMVGVLTGGSERPVVEYWVNEKHGAATLGEADASVGVIDAVVNRVFSACVADTMAGIIDKAATDLVKTGSPVNSEMRTGVDGAKRDLKNAIEGVDGAKASIDAWRATVSDANKTLDSFKTSVPNLQSALDDGEKLLEDARKTSHEVSSAYSSALAQGGDELKTVLEGVAEKVAKSASAIASKQGDVDSALKQAKAALGECDRLIAALRKADPTSNELSELEKKNEELQAEIAKLEKTSEAVGDAAEKADEATEALSKDVKDIVSGMKDRNDEFNKTTLPKLDSGLDSVAIVMGTLKGALGSLESQVDQTKTLLGELDGVLQKTKESLDTAAESLDSVEDSISSARSDLAALSNSRAVRKVSNIVDIDAKNSESHVSTSVNAQVKQVYAPSSYGAGMAPFYTSLAIWVACFMLIAVMKPEADLRLAPRMRPWQGHLGRLMLFVFLALIQGVVVTVGDIVLGVHPVGSVSLIVAGALTAFCFINVVHALAVTFEHVGKALAAILLVVQVPGALGLYPVELMPGFFQALRAWLPFTYSMQAMGEAIGGFYGASYAQCLMWLLACGLASFGLAVFVRPRVAGVSRLFNRKLGEAGVYVVEERDMETGVLFEHVETDDLLEAGIGRAQMQERANRLARRYKLVQQGAPIAIVALIVCLGIVSALLGLDTNGKLMVLASFAIAVIAVFCLCVAFEYANDNLAVRLARMPAEEVADANSPAFTQVFWGDRLDDPGEDEGADE